MPRIKTEVFCFVCDSVIPFIPGKKRKKYCFSCKDKARISFVKKYKQKPNGKKCRYCLKLLLGEQKKYCSTKCQGQGNRERLTKKKIKKICRACEVTFECVPSQKNRKKYCSRRCKDKHQKQLYLKKGNPSWNRKFSSKERKERSSNMKILWATSDSFRNKVNKGQLGYKEKTGFWPGTDPTSQLKKQKTNIKKFGSRHNWSSKTIRNKCEKTCLEKYGKHSWEIALSKLPKSKTKIEKVIQKLLIKHEIRFKQQFRIYFNGRKFKQYDFYLPEKNVLIEADGDYWHGNPKIYKTLNETQILNKENDFLKEKLAKERQISLMRYWESDILKEGFEKILIEDLGRYEEIQG